MCGRLDIDEDPTGVRFYQNLRNLRNAIKIELTPRTEEPAPVILNGNQEIIAKWGFPKLTHKGNHYHARQDAIYSKPTWLFATSHGRGIIPVHGWWEGFWKVSSPGSYIAVLWCSAKDGERFAVITRDPPYRYKALETFPVALTESGATHWLERAVIDPESPELVLSRPDGQGSIFDA